MAKKLVTYFSVSGTTKAVAERLAKAIGADIDEIEPAQPYTAADLDWRDSDSRSSREEHDHDARPAMAHPIDVSGYDTVFIGYPLWWESDPHIIRTFLESQDFAGKNVVTFATSGSSTRGADGSHLHEYAPRAVWHTGRRLPADASEKDLKAWADSLGL